MTAKCTSIWGHRFEPRYSYGEPNLAEMKGGALAVIELTKVSRSQTYHGDVCVRCGAVVNVAKPEGGA